MTCRVGAVCTVVLAVLLVTATGPSAAYESSQAVPSIDPPETADAGDVDDLALESETAPVSTVSFDGSVHLDRQWPAFDNETATADASLQTYTVNVSVRDPGVDLADQGYDEADQRDLH